MIKFGKLSTICLLLLTVFIIYFQYLPVYIQGGDTSELVSSAYFNLVAHPPGYPLWNLLQGFCTHAIPFKSIYWRASLLNSLFAVGTLSLVALLLRRQWTLMVFIVCTLAFSTSFFSAAVLPDVFSLHSLIVSAICFLYIDQRFLKMSLFGIPFLFFLGMSNHHTIIFLIPIIVAFFYNHWKKQARLLLLGGCTGFFISAFLYVTILWKNTSSYYSWGNVDNFHSLWGHFLRADYGTIQLSPNQKDFQFNLFSIFYFFKIHFLYLFGFIILLLKNRRSVFCSEENMPLFISLILSLIFLGLANFKIEGMGAEVVQRFQLMPFILIVFLMISIFKKVKTGQVESILLLCLALSTSTIELYNNRSLSSDSLIENYSGLLLRESIENKANIIVSSNDNIYFGLRYLKLMNPLYSHIAIISPSLLFHQWYFEKVQKVLPKFTLKDSKRIFKVKEMNLEEDFLKQNIENYSFLFSNNFQNSQNFKLTYLQLGRLISKGSGVDFESNINVPSLKLDISSFQGFSKKQIAADYSHYYLASGMSFYSQRKKEKAIDAWKKAIALIPYCYPAYLNICEVEKKFCEKENILRIKEESTFIF